MNILYIDHYAGSTSMGMEFRPYYFAREWQKMGHKIRIIAANYSHLRKSNPTVNNDFEIQCIDEVEFQWIKTRAYVGNGVARAISIFQFCIKLWCMAPQIVKEFKPDVVIASSTYPLDTYPAQRIKKFSSRLNNKGCKYIHEGHDIWPLTLTEIGGMSKKNPFVVLLSVAERSAYRESDQIVSVLPNSVEHMLDNGLDDKKKFHYIPNGIFMEDWLSKANIDIEIPQEHKLVFDKLKEEHKFIVGYVGGHALSNALDTLIDAANMIKDNVNIAIVLVGNGVEKESLIDKVNELSLTNVYFLSSVKKNEIPLILEQMDVVYVALKKSPLYRYGVCLNKLYDYMMAGKPIIYGVNAANNEVAEAEAGISIEADDRRALVNAITLMSKKSAEEMITWSKNAHDWVRKERDYANLSKQFIQIIVDSKL